MWVEVECCVMGTVCLDGAKILRWGKGSGVMRGESKVELGVDDITI